VAPTVIPTLAGTPSATACARIAPVTSLKSPCEVTSAMSTVPPAGSCTAKALVSSGSCTLTTSCATSPES